MDCIFESTGRLGDDASESTELHNNAISDDEGHDGEGGGNFVQRWVIDTNLALQDLRRALKIDAHPPPLERIVPQTVVPPQGHALTSLRQQRYGHLDLQSPTDAMQRDAHQLLQDAEHLLGCWRLPTTPARDVTTIVQDLHHKVSLLRPGYAAELCDRIDATLKEATKWQQGKAELCRELAVNDDQLKETVQLVQFLNTEVGPSVPMILEAARHVQTLAPLYQAASDRLAFLGILTAEPAETSARRVSDLMSNLREMDAAITESEEACLESVAAFQSRIEKLNSKRAPMR